ncbi:uroporphyrin-III C-methyltransferase/precorrin-2 dehydrogenase/sirohydrochlorin ferrochelatase [Dongia mobilis]|uniref:precorrin-2 dehydrogenase n=1 Tax=Dongia mobilis TaxID=578943 RepID=A0A4R6WNH3_9PROT|nr:siroheme synthase [Dongia mobilis]TDQ77699.1 uroporphyrin-III C-methyltransferase/precorrin-2 dehydrogenase/sirohydrochlorin ferrochelatase [Dongia mobilis]
MRAFPLFVRLENRPVLLVGGGAMAAAKLRLLLAADARVAVVAPVLSPDLHALLDHRVTWHGRDFAAEDVRGKALVFSAIGDEARDAAVSAAAREAGILVNVVDRPDHSDLVMPAVVDRGDIVVAISTNGASPVLAQRVRAAVEAAIPHGIEKLVAFARRFRSAVHHRIVDHDGRRRFWSGFFDGPIAAAVLAGREREGAREIIRAINGTGALGREAALLTEIEVDPMQADLLTLRDLRALQRADLVLFDAAIAGEIVDLARRDARRIGWDAQGPAIQKAALAAGDHVVRVKARRQMPQAAAGAR